VFNELVEAELNPRDGFNPSYMIDQSHNVTDPIESMLSSAEAIAGCFARALLVDRAALHAAQEANDTMMAFQALRRPTTPTSRRSSPRRGSRRAARSTCWASIATAAGGIERRRNARPSGWALALCDKATKCFRLEFTRKILGV
jgi:L-rhamnose isomerase